MKINSQLSDLYAPRWSSLIEHGRSISDPVPTSPLLLRFDEEVFSMADKRIMICGQETWGWEDFGSSIDVCIAGYDRFFINREFYDGYGRSAFWKVFRFFESRFAEVFEGQRLQFIWQNLSKMGRNDGKTGVTEEIRRLERLHFPVFKDEMTILRPDIVLFLTGPNRDHDIEFHFPDAEFHQAGREPNLRRRAFVSSSSLPAATLRLYHPNYYRAWTEQYREDALTLITSMPNQALATEGAVPI